MHDTRLCSSSYLPYGPQEQFVKAPLMGNITSTVTDGTLCVYVRNHKIIINII